MGSNSADSKERQILQHKERSLEININRNSSIDNHQRRQSFLPNKYHQFEVELYGPTGSKRKTKTSKRIPDISASRRLSIKYQN
jgi:hypothetical protein